MLQSPDLIDVTSRFQAPTNAAFNLRQSVLTCLENRNLTEASSRAEVALRDGVVQNDRPLQAFACALLATVYAIQNKFDKAVHWAEDSYRLFHRMGDQIHNAMVAKMLLAAIYRIHLDAISRALVHTLEEGRRHSSALSSKALSKGEITLAEEYESRSAEFGDWIRRARWIEAFPHLLPLVWVPVVDSILADPETYGTEIKSYMEPVLFILKTKKEAEAEEKGDLPLAHARDVLYTARSLPLSGDSDSISAPPRLRPNGVYAAVKIDPESARLPGFEPDDYLLVRTISSAERAELIGQADSNISGLYFEVSANGKVTFVNAIPPKFVGEDHVKMFVAQVDAILRRVP